MTQRQSTDTLAQGLGWFSIALGAAELMAPKAISRALGMPGRENLVRAYGVREIASGIAVLASAKRKPWLWGRVAGDALDLATLAGGNRRARLAMGGVAAVTALDIYAATREEEKPPPKPARDYSDRRGFPDTPEKMRGIARREESVVRDAAILNPLL